MIGQDTIDRVRREARLVVLVGERVKLQQRGRSYVGLCPFHQEKTPSFHVNPERGFYHCFGCGASGDAIKFLRELEGLSFVDAVRHIAEGEGIEIVETGSEQEVRQQAELRRRREELYRAGEMASEFFQRMLLDHPLAGYARTELQRRGLDPATEGDVAEALHAFRVGYAPYTWDGLSTYLRSQGISHSAAEKVGLLVPRANGSGHYDRFRHRLMFAVHDLEGRVIAFSGRSLDDPPESELRAAGVPPMTRQQDFKPAKYVNSPESPIYRKREAVFGLFQARQHVRRLDRAIVVEGNFDVLSLHARGVKNAVAPLGTAFTHEQGRHVRRFSSNVTLLFDGDEAGRRAAKASRAACNEAGLVARVAVLPPGKDPDDLIRSGGAESIERCVSAAKSMLEYLIDTTLDRFAADDSRGRAAKIREVSELIAGETDPTVRALAERHADAIAQRLGIADARTFRALASTVQRALHSAGREDDPQTARVQPPERARSRDQRAEIAREIFGALLDFPELLRSDELGPILSAASGELALAIAALRHCVDQGDGLDVEAVLAKLPTSIHPFAAARLAAPRYERLDDAKSVLSKNVEKLNRLEHSRHKSQVIDELARVQASGDFDQELTLLREQQRRARERHGV